MPSGGARPGSGRKPGVLNTANTSLRDLCRQYAQDAVDALLAALRSDNVNASVTAARELLDRGFGRPVQSVDAVIHQEAREMSEAELLAICSVASATEQPAASDAAPVEPPEKPDGTVH